MKHVISARSDKCLKRYCALDNNLCQVIHDKHWCTLFVLLLLCFFNFIVYSFNHCIGFNVFLVSIEWWNKQHSQILLPGCTVLTCLFWHSLFFCRVSAKTWRVGRLTVSSLSTTSCAADMKWRGSSIRCKRLISACVTTFNTALNRPVERIPPPKPRN